MENSLHIAGITKAPEHNDKSRPKQRLVAAIPKNYPQKAFKRILNMDQHIFGMGPAAGAGLFLLKLAAVEAVRRFSKAHCSSMWPCLQALQFVCLPPLKWIQKWGVFRGLINFMQALSRPMLVLSVATSFSDLSAGDGETSGSSDASPSTTDTPSDSPANLEPADLRTGEVTRSQAPEEWITQLLSELEKEGLILPERITEDELRRFYGTANGDFSRFLTSVKKTIRWRQNFRFLSVQELEGWSEIVFWHGRDVEGHPCLIVRLAPACSNIMPEESSRLPEVVASQVEHGIVHLVHPEDPLVTVLMDCEGLTPFRFPVQMMRSCATLLQDHYPNRLAALFVVRLPSVARVIAQTLFQVLRPGTRQKLQILGDDYQKVLSEHIQALPSSLGGDCLCAKCSKLIGPRNNMAGPSRQQYEAEKGPSKRPSAYHTDDFEYVKRKRVLQTVIIGLLLLLICIVIAGGIHDLQGIRLYSL